MQPGARAFWVTSPGRGEIRPVALGDPGPDDVVVRTLFSGISRGTESLVFRGGVPADQYTVMRAPFQDGEFPAPVKYGYLSVGIVERGDPALVGRTVFCLYPHQTAYVVPVSAVALVPDAVPPRRAVLAGMVETAVNALWDAAPLIGDRIAVVGAGTLGCCVARIARGIPGADITLVDVDRSKADIARGLQVAFREPASAPGARDLVFHTSSTGAGLQSAVDLLAPEGRVVELSWYGDSSVTLSLGGRFHSSRLGIVASQVGTVSPRQHGRRTHHDRIRFALELLEDPVFDTLLTGSSPFEELPAVLPRIADGTLPVLCHTVDYSN